MRKTKLRRQQEAVHRAFGQETSRIHACYERLKTLAKRAKAADLLNAAEKIDDATDRLLGVLADDVVDLPSLLKAEQAFNEYLWEQDPTNPGDEDEDLNDPPPADWKPARQSPMSDEMRQKVREAQREIAERNPWTKKG